MIFLAAPRDRTDGADSLRAIFLCFDVNDAIAPVLRTGSYRPIADIRRTAHNQEMSASNDNEELATLRYFMQCYWHQNADLVDGDLRATTTVFASHEERAMLRGLLADLAKVRARGFFSARWPKKGPIYDFWADMGDRIISDEEAKLIAEVVERHLG